MKVKIVIFLTFGIYRYIFKYFGIGCKYVKGTNALIGIMQSYCVVAVTNSSLEIPWNSIGKVRLRCNMVSIFLLIKLDSWCLCENIFSW